MIRSLALLLLLSSPQEQFREISAEDLEDKIRGGLLAQIFGNLNGLPHEFKYIAEPGKVEAYTPGLPDGARTDDDTDIEWVYLAEMDRLGKTLLPPERIAELWKANLNGGIWCANRHARSLMDLGLEPPLTGRIALNPWAGFNISAQFVSESFGHVAPGMPRTAARIGIHYTHTAVDGEPIQTTQLFTAMISVAFFEKDVLKIVEAGLASLDSRSAVREVVTDVIGWWRENPRDWKETRRKIKEKYTRHGGGMRDRNGYELNTAAIIGSLLYGGVDDLAEVLRLAFNFGWDSDCNAATAGAIVGVIRGRKWMDAQGWVVKDVYRNTCRDAMPKDETITGFGDKLVRVARRVILENGGEEIVRDGKKFFRIRTEAPGNVEPLPATPERLEELRARLLPEVEKGLGDARSAYLALCLGEAERFRKERPQEWTAGIEALKRFPNVVREIYDAPHPSGARLQSAARAEGIEKPKKK